MTSFRDERGFTLLEMLMTVAILATMFGMAIAYSPNFIRQQKAEAGVSQALEVLRNAREIAISQRRNVRVQFVGNDTIQAVRENIPAGTTLVRSVRLEGRVQFLRVVGGDTPDGFGLVPPNSATAFGTALPIMFTSEGTLVNGNGDVLNGTLFLAIPNQANSQRAVSIFGTTALLRPWKWDGSKWVE